MIMTAHVLYPAFDPDLPATLSAWIINDLLRHQLGFAGVVVSDDLEMGAIVRHGSVEQASSMTRERPIGVRFELSKKSRAKMTCNSLIR